MNSTFPRFIASALAFASAASLASDPKFVGDVVGRALSFSGLEGHVGLWTGSQVLEMTTGGMATTSLRDFKTAGRNSVYYGAKGQGAVNRTAVPAAALAQRAFQPTYTGFAEYWPGGVFQGQKFDLAKRKWVSVTRQFPGKFRCDTLVNFAYRQGGPGHVRAMTLENNREMNGPNEYYVRIRAYTARGQSITPNQLYATLPASR